MKPMNLQDGESGCKSLGSGDGDVIAGHELCPPAVSHERWPTQHGADWDGRLQHPKAPADVW